MRSNGRLNFEGGCPHKFEDLSFDDWKNLHQTEPERFEKYRRKLLNNLVESAPERSKPRLRGLIFQMEAEAIRSKTPMAFNIRLSAMMMEMVEELRRQLNRLVENKSANRLQSRMLLKTATILPFNRNPTPKVSV